MMIKIYDEKNGRIVTQFPDMCTTTSSTAEAIYSVMDTHFSELLSSANPWAISTSVGVDNNSVNIGICNFLKIRILQRNSAIYFNGSPCYVLHNAAQKADTAFAT